MLAQCSISIPPGNVRVLGFLTFSGDIEMEHWANMVIQNKLRPHLVECVPW